MHSCLLIDLFTLSHQGVQCYTAALSPDGWVLAAGWNDNIVIWNWMTGEEVRSNGVPLVRVKVITHTERRCEAGGPSGAGRGDSAYREDGIPHPLFILLVGGHIGGPSGACEGCKFLSRWHNAGNGGSRQQREPPAAADITVWAALFLWLFLLIRLADSLPCSASPCR